MHVSDEAIAEFKAIWKKEFGEEISDERARKRGQELVDFYKMLVEHKYEREAKGGGQLSHPS